MIDITVALAILKDHGKNIYKLLTKELKVEAFFFLVVALLLTIGLAFGSGNFVEPVYQKPIIVTKYLPNPEPVPCIPVPCAVVPCEPVSCTVVPCEVVPCTPVPCTVPEPVIYPKECDSIWNHFTAPKPEPDPPLWYMGGNGGEDKSSDTSGNDTNDTNGDGDNGKDKADCDGHDNKGSDKGKGHGKGEGHGHGKGHGKGHGDGHGHGGFGRK